MESPRSPKRRRILSSINPPEPNSQDEPPRSHKRDRTMSPGVPSARVDETRAKEQDNANARKHPLPDPGDGDAAAPRPTKFRFKSESSRTSRRRDRDQDGDDDHHHHRRHRRHRSRSPSRDRDKDKDRDRAGSRERRRRHRHHHHHRRRHRSRSPAPNKHQPGPDPDPDPFQDPPLSPNTAFRESLFDAMADDEGAAYWESVYGQPIHIYPPPGSGGAGGGGGHLERMTDDEYAAYVRQKMWEKTHAGLLEARARRERQREEERKRAEEEARVARQMERCLRRGEERRRRRGWRERWEGYVRRWAEWEGESGKGGVEGIPWPDGVGVAGEGKDIERETVRAFFVNGIGLEELGEREFAARLKEERVRWHPDKMQQRLGGKVDDKVMRDVTAIFQVVDALWNDTRKKDG